MTDDVTTTFLIINNKNPRYDQSYLHMFRNKKYHPVFDSIINNMLVLNVNVNVVKITQHY